MSSSECLFDSNCSLHIPTAKTTANNIVWMENGFAHMDSQHYDLTFDRHFHGKNIKIDESGRTAHKIKK
jgi:hypothetical protein